MITIDGGRSDDLECRIGADVDNSELDAVVIVWTPTGNCNTPLCSVDDGFRTCVFFHLGGFGGENHFTWR